MRVLDAWAPDVGGGWPGGWSSLLLPDPPRACRRLRGGRPVSSSSSVLGRACGIVTRLTDPPHGGSAPRPRRRGAHAYCRDKMPQPPAAGGPCPQRPEKGVEPQHTVFSSLRRQKALRVPGGCRCTGNFDPARNPESTPASLKYYAHSALIFCKVHYDFLR